MSTKIVLALREILRERARRGASRARRGGATCARENTARLPHTNETAAPPPHTSRLSAMPLPLSTWTQAQAYTGAYKKAAARDDRLVGNESVRRKSKTPNKTTWPPSAYYKRWQQLFLDIGKFGPLRMTIVEIMSIQQLLARVSM